MPFLEDDLSAIVLETNAKEMRMKLNLLLVICLLSVSTGTSSAAPMFSIDTKSSDLFENVVSDTILLLDPGLKKIIESDFSRIVDTSKFTLQSQSWMPRQNPRIKLDNIYNDINSGNIKESFSSLVQPIIELACTPPQGDPLNEKFSYCVRTLIAYRIVNPMEIAYSYSSPMTVDELAAFLAIQDSDKIYSKKYRRIIYTLAHLMNGAYENMTKKKITRDVHFVKRPIPMVGVVPEGATNKVESDNSWFEYVQKRDRAEREARAAQMAVEEKNRIENEKLELLRKLNNKLTPSSY